MLHARPFVDLLLFVVIAIVLFWPSQGRSTAALRRITNTTEESLSLNPSISGDGDHVAFESTEAVAHLEGSSGFQALRADISQEPAVFAQLGTTRAVAPAISQDGSRIAFASTDDLVGKNWDRNSEIFLFDGSALQQITNTTPGDVAARVHDGNFQPSITDDGSFIAFSSNRNLVGRNADLNFEIFLFNTTANTLTQLTSSQEIVGATEAKISGDGSHIAYVRDTGASPGSHRDLLLHERTSGVTITIANGAAALSLTYGRAISDDGLRVVYSAEIAENQSQVFLFDSRSNLTRQITSFDPRGQDVPFHATISGDGKRLAFATRRKVSSGTSDGSVELYVFDIPTAQFTQLTDAPSTATAEVVSSLNDDGTTAVFNFPRVLSGPVTASALANNSEIYATAIARRPAFGELAMLNGASLGNEPSTIKGISPGSIGIARGKALANRTEQAQRLTDGAFPLSLDRTTVTLNGRAAQVLYVSPTQVNFVAPTDIELGQVELIITNADGFQSKANVTILPAAPGVFTESGDGRGEGLVLNADSLLGGPFDPSDNKLRLIIFSTGVRDARNISVSLGGWAVAVESNLRSPDLPGLDEIHVLVPSGLRGAGAVDLIVAADNHESNTVTVTLTGSSQREVIINEILADPPDSIAGDANHDGARDTSHDEFVELINTTARDLDISGYELQSRGPGSTADVLRHRFAPGTVFPAGTAIVVFGGGNPDSANVAFAGAQILKASTGGLSLLNSGAAVTLGGSSGAIITFLSYGGSTGLRGDANQSLTRAPDITGNFTLHQSAPESGGTLFSPGTHLNGDQFSPSPTATPSPSPTPVTSPSPSPTPSPFVSPTPSPSPSPSPTETPSPSPSPSATPTPSPSPSPSPSPVTMVVISQIYGGGGNSGAPFRYDFIELFNSGGTTVSLAGWSVQYASATATAWSVTNLSPVSLAPGEYCLIQESSGGATGVDLPTADVTGTIAMAVTAGKVALVNTTTALNGSCATASGVIDLVGYGTSANCFKGSGPAGSPSNTTSTLRKNSGCLDTQNNLNDFVTGAPTPRNTSSTTNPCGGPIPPTAISEEYHNHWRELLELLFVGTSFDSPCSIE